MIFNEASNNDGKLSDEEKKTRLENLKKGQEIRDKKADTNNDGKTDKEEKLKHLKKNKKEELTENCILLSK